MKQVTLEDISRMMRQQAWERAKGELNSMLCTFKTPANAEHGQFDTLDKTIAQFINAVEENSLHE